MKSRTLTCITAMTLFAALAVPVRLCATFPGKNGRIAFLLGPDIYSMNADGSDVQQLTNFGPENSFVAFYNWCPDGRRIVFTLLPPTALPQLWTMNADGSNQQQLFSDPDFQDWAPAFSPDGGDVVFTRCQGTWPAPLTSCALYRVRADGTGLIAITNFAPDVNEWEAAYSPDGAAIAFEAFDLNGYLTVTWLVDGDGGNLRPLTPPEICALHPDWHPTGARLAFWDHSCNPETPQIVTLHSDGHGLKNLTSTQTVVNLFPSWAPEGNAIAFTQFDPSTGNSSIVVMNADGSGRRALLTFKDTRRDQLLARTKGAGGRDEKRKLKIIEQGGFYPKWGAAPAN